MKNNWSNLEAKKYIKKYTKLGHSKDMALRVYTTRLLGRNSELVLHGGGNTSVKTSIKDIDGKNYEVLCVKGSGWDMAEIEPAGLPAVKLNPLLALKNKKYLKNENSDYEAKRNNNTTMTAPTLTLAPKNSFYKWLADNNKLGGQHKIPRLSNDRNLMKKIKEIIF